MDSVCTHSAPEPRRTQTAGHSPQPLRKAREISESSGSTVELRYFAGIAEAAGTDREEISLPVRGALASALIPELARRHGEEFVQKLAVCALFSGGAQLAMTAHLPSQERIFVDVLPPFAGG